MRAIILAAGRGNRLGPLGDRLPKCLLRFGGESLLERHLAGLRALAVREVGVVIGHRAGDVITELHRLAAWTRPAVLYNPDFERGSVVSLSAASALLEGGGDVLVMDADVLYDPAVLERVVRAPGNRFLLDRNFDDTGGEAVKLCVRDGSLVELRKALPADLVYDFAGESVGFFRFDESMSRALAARTAAYVAAGRGGEPHEEAIRDLLLEAPSRFAYEDVTGLPWIEIDFPEDVARAEREILPRLRSHRPGASPAATGRGVRPDA
jgi:choline kinase